MCSIFGILDIKTGASALRPKALEYSRLLRHRGPDWSGIYHNDNAILVHERLSIVDVKPVKEAPKLVEEQLAITAETTSLQDDAIAELERDTLEMEEEFNDFKASNQPKVKEQALADKNNEVLEQNQIKERRELELAKDNPFVQQVENLTVGCWFEFREESEPVRCKLAAVIKVTGKYIFVNRSGVKVAEKTVAVLADEMRRGCIQILNDGLLFDRALESVIGSLRHSSLN